MKVPKFKPTKWKLKHCNECKYTGHSIYYNCKQEKHSTSEIDNVPFFVPDMKIIGFGYKNWVHLRSDALGENFEMASTRLRDIILSCGVGAKGDLSNHWWMYGKVGGCLTIVLVE